MQLIIVILASISQYTELSMLWYDASVLLIANSDSK